MIHHESLAKQAGVSVRHSGMNISTANGSGMTVVGEADVRISYDKYVRETTALVSSDVKCSLQVAWHDLQSINVLSQNFPACILATVSESMKNSVVKEFGIFLTYLKIP